VKIGKQRHLFEHVKASASFPKQGDESDLPGCAENLAHAVGQEPEGRGRRDSETVEGRAEKGGVKWPPNAAIVNENKRAIRLAGHRSFRI